MNHILSIQKVALTACLTGALSLIFTGFVTLRPNRLMPGKAINLHMVANPFEFTIIITVLACLAVFSLVSIAERLRLSIMASGPAVIIPVMFAAAGSYASFIAREAGHIARVSLGPAFWISLFAMVILITDAFQRSDRQTRIITVLTSLASGAAVLLLVISGRLENLSLMKEFISRQDRFTGELVSHVTMAGTAVLFALIIGVPLGILAQRKRKLRGPAFFALNTLQTVPSLALFGILIPTLAALTTRFPALKEAGIQGIGTAPALIALTVYSLLPVARNTYTGFTAVDHSIVEAGRGMGMTSWQILLKVELPIAFPVIFNGIRIALVQAIGLTAVAALIGAGGFGVFIFQGLGQAATDLILLGAIPTILIAVLADTAMNGLIALVKPKGMT